MIEGDVPTCMPRCWVALGKAPFPTVSDASTGAALRSTDSKSLVKTLARMSSVYEKYYPHVLSEGVRKALCAVAPGSMR